MKTVLISGLAIVGAVLFAPQAFANHRFHNAHNYPGFCDGGDTIARCMFARHNDDDFWDRWNFITCNEAREILADRDYSKIKTVSCKGTLYVFKARWKGKSYELKVARRNGALRSARKI
jgi:hypothetical protein